MENASLIPEVGNHALRWFPGRPHNLGRQVLTHNLVTTLARESESASGKADRLWVLASAHGVPGLLPRLSFSTAPDTQDKTWTGIGGDSGSWITDFWSAQE